MSDTAIDVLNLKRCYNSHPVVDEISFSVRSGSIFGLLGPNGAGKSTTIKMLTTLLPVTSGTALILGHDINLEPAIIRKHIGYVPQLLSSDGELSGYENLALSAKLHGLSGKERRERINEVLDFMNLSDVADKLVSRYSGGMIRRLEIAQALIHRPKVLFLDEPTVGLDPAARKSLWVRIKELSLKHETTILMTTHDMEEADLLCDVLAFMNDGHIMAMNSPNALKASIGPESTLGDVFIQFTGRSIKESGDYHHVMQTRESISHRE